MTVTNLLPRMDHYAFIVADRVPEFFLLSFYASQFRQQNLQLVLRLVVICMASFRSVKVDGIMYVSVKAKLVQVPGRAFCHECTCRVHNKCARTAGLLLCLFTRLIRAYAYVQCRFKP